MKTTCSLGIVIVTCFALGCKSDSQREEQLTVDDALPKYAVNNLQLYPIRANEEFLRHRKGFGNYLTLHDAVRLQKVKVTEHINESGLSENDRSSAEVNRLYIENESTDTVFILQGEVVVGGQQDRMIARDITLPPHSGKLDLSVFCVEHGRWTGGESFMVTEQSLPPNAVRSKVIETADQEEIWDEVKVNLDVHQADAPTDNIGSLKSNARYMRKIKDYTDKLDSAFVGHADVIGIIAVAGGKVIACDLFATPALFGKHYTNLLQSYAAQAIDLDDQAPISKAQVDSYLRDLLKEDRAKGFIVAKGERVKKERVAHLSGL
ncbi:MAG: DUF6569 family protein [Cyclobacteriaceae bacterium]